MIKKYLSATIFFLMIFKIHAQMDSIDRDYLNLVLNPGFEEFHDKIPCNFYYTYQEFNSALKNWKTPNPGKPNVFNIKECQPDFFYSPTEDSLLPHSGNMMVGIQTYKGIKSYNEYIQGTLKEPLTKGISYFVEFYISRNFNAKYASNNLGFCFIDEPLFQNDKGPIKLKPEIEIREILRTKKGEWIKISKIITAKSNSKYFLIGNFNEYEKTKFIEASHPRAEGNSALGTATYFIDDVSVVKKWNEDKNIKKDTTSAIIAKQKEDCSSIDNLINNSQFNDYEIYSDENDNLVYSPLYWHYDLKKPNHPVYFSTDKFLNKSIMKNNYHPDSQNILLGDTINDIGITILPKSESVFTELNCSLEKDCFYTLSMKIKSYGYSNCFSDLFVDFSNNNPKYSDTITNTIKLTTPDTITPEFIRNDWVKLTLDFKAQGGEKYLLIGSDHRFEYQEIILKNLNKFDGRNKHVRDFNLNYLIDDVVLKRINCIQSESLFDRLDSLKIGESFVLNYIFFDFDKSELKELSYPYLEELIKYLKSNQQIKILIIGHTDNHGTESYNVSLSTRRAKAIYDYIVVHGIDNSRLKYEGIGASQNISLDDSKNRRVEIKIIEK